MLTDTQKGGNVGNSGFRSQSFVGLFIGWFDLLSDDLPGVGLRLHEARGAGLPVEEVTSVLTEHHCRGVSEFRMFVAVDVERDSG